jgi:hypothetical protein
MTGSERGAGEDRATQVFPEQDAVVTRLVEPPGEEPQSATEIVPPQAATEVVPPQPATEIVAPQPAAEETDTHVVPQQPPTVVADSPGSATDAAPAHPPTEVASPGPTDAAPAHPPTEIAATAPVSGAAPAHPPTEIADSPAAAAPSAPALAAPAPSAPAASAPAAVAPAAAAPESTVGAAPGQAAGPGQLAPPAPLPSTADAMPPRSAAGIVRYGPGVPVVLPVSQGGRTAEHIWRGSQPPASPPRSARWRRLGGSALTVLLLVASGVILFLRFYHPAFQVTGATVSQHTAAGCRVDVTGRVTTNGSAGTVTYQWLFKPGGQQATTLSQSVSSGQDAVDVTAALEGSGQGTASQTAILQVLSPDRRTASTRVTLNC